MQICMAKICVQIYRLGGGVTSCRFAWQKYAVAFIKLGAGGGGRFVVPPYQNTRHVFPGISYLYASC